MRLVRSKLRSRLWALLACLLLFFTGILVVQYRRSKQLRPLPIGPCYGAETVVKERSEDYVQKFSKKLTKEAKKLERAEQQLDIVFYGDSIAETWRGTDMGRECSRCDGGPEVFERFFSSRYTAHIFAVGGDQTAHLQWRLLHGQILTHLAPRVTVLMIGTNDLGADAACFKQNSTASAVSVRKAFARIEGILQFLRTHTPSSKVLIVGLTPRGVWSAEKGFEWPSIFTTPVNSINQMLRKLAMGDDHVHYIDCGDMLLSYGKIDERMQGDGLHPTPEGLGVLASCILNVLQGIIGPGDQGGHFMDSSHPLGTWLNQKRASGHFWDG